MNEEMEHSGLILSPTTVSAVESSAEGGGFEYRSCGSGGGGSRIREPWSHEEDVILRDLVHKSGAKNWGLIAQGIPGRSGKSCRLRWYNQLDPCLNRKPFTEEEDRTIVAAHAIHGNKWSIIAKLLPGRTDNSIKNHWNSGLKRMCISPLRDDQSNYKMLMEDHNLHSRTTQRVLLEEKTSQNVSLTENETHIPEAKSPTKQGPTLSRPVPRISAFNVYDPRNEVKQGSMFSRTDPNHRPLPQPSKPDLRVCNFLEDFSSERIVPLRCGHGCCDGAFAQKSILGHEFVEYEELPALSSQELVTMAMDISTIAWIKSGLDNHTPGQKQAHGEASSLHKSLWSMNNEGYFCQERKKLPESMKDAVLTEIPLSFALPAEVGGLS